MQSDEEGSRNDVDDVLRHVRWASPEAAEREWPGCRLHRHDGMELRRDGSAFCNICHPATTAPRRSAA